MIPIKGKSVSNRVLLNCACNARERSDEEANLFVAGATHEFEVTAVSQTALSGGGETIEFDDIELLKREEIDTDETIKTVGSGVGIRRCGPVRIQPLVALP